MKRKLTTKKVWLAVIFVAAAFILAGCQNNVDPSGKTLPERIIYLDTPWTAMFNESILTAVLVYPLAQVINFLGKNLDSAVLGITITTIIYNILTMAISVKSTVSAQKMQMMQPELNRIQAKYAGRNDENSRMAQAQEMNALYKKAGVNPLGSIATPLLTFPIMIAMYYATQRAEVVVNGDLFNIPLITTPLAAFKDLKNLWPIAVLFVLMLLLQIASSLLPQKLAEWKRKKQKNYKAYADNGPSNNNQMITMLLMTVVLIGWLGIRWPAAMSAYWAVSSAVNIAKTLYIQRRYIDHE